VPSRLQITSSPRQVSSMAARQIKAGHGCVQTWRAQRRRIYFRKSWACRRRLPRSCRSLRFGRMASSSSCDSSRPYKVGLRVMVDLRSRTDPGSSDRLPGRDTTSKCGSIGTSNKNGAIDRSLGQSLGQSWPKRVVTRRDGPLPRIPLRSQALFRWLLLDPVAALCNGNHPEWRRYICGTEERCIGLVIGEILIDAPERVLG
jgi:hypothetical protein